MHLMKINLNGAWRLYSYPNDNAPTDPSELHNDCIEAEVPGNVELDYQRAGLLSDLLETDHVKQAESLERSDFWYVRDFIMEELPKGNLILHFDGVDTVASYFLNGRLIGQSDNMLIPHEFCVSGLLQTGENTLSVHIKSALKFAEAFDIEPYNVAFPGCYENLHVRKSAINYGWDISPRLLSAGIWKDVWLEEQEETRFRDVYLATASVTDDVAVLVLSCNADIPEAHMGKCTLSIEGICGDHHFFNEYPLPFRSTTVYPYVHGARLWYPQGMGEQNLYDVRIRINCDHMVLAEKDLLFGIRKIDLHYGNAVGDEGDFSIHVNNRLCRCRGVNWVPLSLLHSQDKDKYEQALIDLRDAKFNMVRVWGGGVYEQDRFYDLCDEYGIMVWQDIMLACHAYPSTERFCKAMSEECEAVAKRLRNHPSIALYCGGNETDWPYVCVGLDPNDDPISRDVIPKTFRRFDPYRAYLPSTPYFSREFIQKHGGRFYLDLDEIKKARVPLPQEHYWWHREEFLQFREQQHRFITEIGYSGSSSRDSLDRYLPKGYSFRDDTAWKYHSYPTEGSRTRGVEYLFTSVPDNDDDRIRASQYYQAEAYKFIVELSRMREQCNGILLWTLRENWPSFSSALVDYYGTRKPAFHTVTLSCEPVQCMIDIEGSVAKVFLINDGMIGRKLSIKVTDENGLIRFEDSIFTPSNALVEPLAVIELNNEKLLLTEIFDGDRTIRNYRFVYTKQLDYSLYDNLYKKHLTKLLE